jgi:hypothetical protein
MWEAADFGKWKIDTLRPSKAAALIAWHSMLAREDHNPPIDDVLDVARQFCDELGDLQALIVNTAVRSNRGQSGISRETRQLLFSRRHVAEPVFAAVMSNVRQIKDRLDDPHHDDKVLLEIENGLAQLSLELSDVGL